MFKIQLFHMLVNLVARILGARTIVTSNIRGWDQGKDGKVQSWLWREPFYCAWLRFAQPSIIGFQELVDENREAIEKALPNHKFFASNYVDNKQRNLIGWNTLIYSFIDGGCFYFNADNQRLPLPGWDAEVERGFTWVQLYDNKHRRFLVHINLHLDNEHELARIESTKQLVEWINIWPEDVAISITGDFNCNVKQRRRDNTPRPYSLLAEIGFINAWLSTGGSWPPPFTYHEYFGEAFSGDDYYTEMIDVIMQRNYDPLGTWILRWHFGNLFLSDHYPLMALVSYARGK